MHDGEKEELARKARALFRRQADELSPEVVRRLTGRRRAVLERAACRQWPLLWLPAGAVAAGLLAITVFQIRDPGAGNGEPVTAGTVVEDLEILFDEEDLDLLEDLDFYAWIGTDVDAG